MYLLVFKGELVAGTNREDAIEALAGVLKKPPEFIRQRLFSGQSIPLRRVASLERANDYVAAFKKAGAILHIETEGTESVPARKVKPTPSSSKKKKIILAGCAVLVALILSAAWWTRPIWLGTSPSMSRQQASAALASEDLIALAHLDVRRTVALEQRLLGELDPDALPDSSAGFWGSLAQAGLSVRTDVDDALVGFYPADSRANYAVVLLGRFDPPAILGLLTQHFKMDGTHPSGNIHYFSGFNEDKCMQTGRMAVSIEPGRLILAPAHAIEPIMQRFDTPAPAELALTDWKALSKSRLVSLAILQPGRMGETLGGIPGLVLSGAGASTLPARSIVLGLRPTLVPPGATLEASLFSDQPAFVEQSYSHLQTALDEARVSATTDWPELGNLFERILLDYSTDQLNARVRFDTDIGEELVTLASSVGSRAFGITQGNGGQPVADRAEEHPVVFGPATPADLKPYQSLMHNNPMLWTGGPFGIRIEQLSRPDGDRLSLTLNAEGQHLPNVASRSELVRLRLTEVLDHQGNSLLEPGCIPSKPKSPTPLNLFMNHFAFVDGESVLIPTLRGDKSLELMPGTNPDQVAHIKGVLEYQLPTDVKRQVLTPPLAGQLIEAAGMRLRFGKAEDNSISYQVSGDSRRLLAVRALNAQGQVLSEMGSSQTDGWFGGGKQVNISVQGKPVQVEVIVATNFTPLSYPFSLPSAYPAMAATISTPTPLARNVAAESFIAALGEAPPDVGDTSGTPDYEIPVGPGLLTIEQLEFSDFRGLYSNIKLYVSDQLPVSGQLAGAVVTFEKAEEEDGTEVELNQSSTVALNPDGGYWMNGTFMPDPERPWYHGETTLQVKDYQAGQPVAITGRVNFQAPASTVTETMAVTPGATWSNEHFSVVVEEWRPNEIGLAIKGNPDRLVGVQALDAQGQPIPMESRLNRWFGYPALWLQLAERPNSLKLQLADKVHEQGFPFRVVVSK